MDDDYGKNGFSAVAEELDFAISNMLASDLSLAQAAPWYDEFSDAMRAQGLLWLMVKADSQKFFQCLAVSGQGRRHLLRRCKREQVLHHQCASGWIDPFLDAV